jgi:riboflavin synthase
VFTGIVQKVGRIRSVEKSPSELRVRVETGFSDVTLGESVAVNGVCLTATESTPEGLLDFYISRETLDRSNLSSLTEGSSINLERALLASERLSGHIVQGHVDGLAKFVGATSVSDSFEVTFELPDSLSRYCVEKGSIALNGVSLTINSISHLNQGREIRIMLIPHTWTNTNLSKLKPGDFVNVEVDVLAKYVERLFAPMVGKGN